MKHLYITLALVLLTAVNACAQFSATITVTDLNTGLPLENATVQLDVNSLTTDAAGEVTFEGLANGDYDYYVSAPCYVPGSGSITIAGADAGASLAIEPMTSNAVFFFVGSPLTIPGATVTLYDDMDFNESLTTGAPFGDSFENVPFGEYSYSITIPCYESVSGTVTVECINGDGMVVFVEPVPTTTNAVFFFVGSPLPIPGATVTLYDGMDYNETLTTGAPFGDSFENVPFGEYSYSITAPCYEPISGNVTVECTNGDGMLVFAEPVPTTTNAVFFFVGSPLPIPGATVTLYDGMDYNETLTTGAPFGDIFENVPFGEYSYSITAPCYEPISGTVTVECTNGDGMLVFAEPVPTTTNAVFFFVGSPLPIPGATVTLYDGMDYNETLTTGAPFGDIFENVPFGEYSYSITAPCYEPISGTVTVECTNGDGMAVFAEPVPTTTNAVFFFVGSPLPIPGATVTLYDGMDYNETLTTGAPFGDIFENVPFGEYSYSITAPCYEPISGTVTVECINGDGMAVFAEPVEVVLDVTVSLDGSTLTATATEVDYQWIDCSTNEPIDGATEQSFTPMANGSYGVIITSGDCAQPSECTTVTVTGLNDIDSNDAFSVYPNPFTDRIMIRSTGLSGTVRVELFSLSGQLVINETMNAMDMITVSTADLAPGSYVIRMSSGATRTSMRVVK